jgi:hypothetical protein
MDIYGTHGIWIWDIGYGIWIWDMGYRIWDIGLDMGSG